MINYYDLERLINEKEDIDAKGIKLQKEATKWSKELKDTVGSDVFSDKGIDWAKVCVKLCYQFQQQHPPICSDRTVENDRG